MENYQEIAEPWEPAASVQARNISLSSSLQRIPADPVKGKDLADNNFTKVLEDQKDEIGVHNLRCEEEDFYAEIKDLEDQMPDVADEIMKNIEQQSLRRHRSPTKPNKSKSGSGPTKKVVIVKK